jgi:hypothetical protein
VGTAHHAFFEGMTPQSRKSHDIYLTSGHFFLDRMAPLVHPDNVREHIPSSLHRFLSWEHQGEVTKSLYVD